MALVVALGPCDQEVVTAALGPDHTLVQNPSDQDLASAEAAIVRANVDVDRAMFDRLPKLKVLARTGVGTERVDLSVATERGIPVLITPGSNTNAVAEGALAMALHLVKQLSPLTNLVREGNWNNRGEFPLGDIEGATIAILGWGRIGKRLGAILEAMGATLRVYDAFAEVPQPYRCASVEDAVSQAQIVSLHMPLTDANVGLFSAKLFAGMQAGTILINCSRGPLVNLDDALKALESGRLGGLGLDVFDEEPPKHHPVFEHPNVVLTPHVMGLSKKAAAQTFFDAAEAIRDALSGQAPRHVAN